jgi:integrase
VTARTIPLLPGVDRHGNGFRVRKQFPEPYDRWIEFHDTVEAANAAALELDRRRRAGLPPRIEHSDPTLREACDLLLTRKRSQVSPKTNRKLTPRGIDYWERSTTPWREGEFANTPVSLLNRNRIEDTLLARGTVAPTSARNERQALFAALELAGERGASFDRRILAIEVVGVEPRRRRDLSLDELDFFVARVPAIGRRLVLAQGTIGNRIEELFLAEPDHVDRDAPGLFVPATNCKEHRDKMVALTPEEVALFAEQLGGLHVVDPASPTSGLPTTPPGAPRIFTTSGMQVYPTGTVRRTKEGPRPWNHTQFDRLVWQPAIRRAAADWREVHGLADVVVAGKLRPAPTPFEWYVDPAKEPADGRRRKNDDGRRTITTHDLRATAITMMRDLGLTEAECAARVGHADGGKLVRAVYDQGNQAARVSRALAQAAPNGLRAALAARRSTKPDVPTSRERT